MKIINNMILCATCVAVLFTGCRSASADRAWLKATEDELVHQQLQKILRCPFLFSTAGKLHVMAIGDIQNDTTLVGNDNIEFMKSQITSELTNCGVVMISTAGNGRTSPPQAKNAIAPTLKLHGKLTQRDSPMKDGRIRCEFTFELSIVDLANGNRIWYGKSVVGIVCDSRILHCEKIVTKSSQCV